MIDTETLIRQAEIFLDTNQYKQAVQLIEHIIHREGPNYLTLSWLPLAREMDYLLFLNALMKQHPNNDTVHFEKINLLLRTNPGIALRFCSEAIEKFKGNQHIEMRFRSMRFEAAVKSHNVLFLADDFIAQWRFYTSEKARPRLMQEVLSISDPRLRSVFSTLIDSGVFSEEIQILFRQKLEQFDLFEKLFPNP